MSSVGRHLTDIGTRYGQLTTGINPTHVHAGPRICSGLLDPVARGKGMYSILSAILTASVQAGKISVGNHLNQTIYKIRFTCDL